MPSLSSDVTSPKKPWTRFVLFSWSTVLRSITSLYASRLSARARLVRSWLLIASSTAFVWLSMALVSARLASAWLSSTPVTLSTQSWASWTFLCWASTALRTTSLYGSPNASFNLRAASGPLCDTSSSLERSPRTFYPFGGAGCVRLDTGQEAYHPCMATRSGVARNGGRPSYLLRRWIVTSSAVVSLSQRSSGMRSPATGSPGSPLCLFWASNLSPGSVSTLSSGPNRAVSSGG